MVNIIIQQLEKEMSSWKNKVCAMFIESAKGQMPQLMKALFMKKSTDEWIRSFKKEIPRKEFKKAEKIINKFFKKSVKIAQINNIQEAEKRLYAHD